MLNKRFIAYIGAPFRNNSTSKISNHQHILDQENQIQSFIKEDSNRMIFKTYIELGEAQRSRHRWPELRAAVNDCLKHHAHLVIGEIKNLTRNEAFSRELLKLIHAEMDPPIEIYCCDQPFIKRDNLVALIEHAKQQKMLHANLIKAGLSRSTAKSGNPHAKEIINKVNKPKIESALVFSLLLQPIVEDYQQQGFSQRKMVDLLNEEGFTAPEGGRWVLSQLQKVLHRIHLNEVALTLKNQLKQYQEKQWSNDKIAETFNQDHIPALNGEQWNGDMVNKVLERINQLENIIQLNEFAIEIMPILDEVRIDELNEERFIFALQKHGITLPPPQKEASHEQR